jgi:hypothetical protein
MNIGMAGASTANIVFLSERNMQTFRKKYERN